MRNRTSITGLRCQLLHAATAPLAALMAALASLLGCWEAQGALAFGSVMLAPISLGGLAGLLARVTGCSGQCCCEDDWGI